VKANVLVTVLKKRFLNYKFFLKSNVNLKVTNVLNTVLNIISNIFY